MKRLMPRFILFSYAIFMGIAAVGMGPSEARATVIWDVTDGILTGAQNVLVDGTLYNVTFADGSCFDLFGGCDEFADFAFNDQLSAEAANIALLSQVFINSIYGEFDAHPELTAGCTLGTDGCFFFIPYGLNPFQGVDTWAYVNVFGDNCIDDQPIVPTQTCPTGDGFGTGGNLPIDIGLDTIWAGCCPPLPGEDPTNQPPIDFTWAIFTVAIPEPSSMFLFGAGLIGLVGIGRRRRRGATTALAVPQ